MQKIHIHNTHMYMWNKGAFIIARTYTFVKMEIKTIYIIAHVWILYDGNNTYFCSIFFLINWYYIIGMEN